MRDIATTEYSEWMLEQRGRRGSLGEATKMAWEFYRTFSHNLNAPKTPSDWYAIAYQMGLEYEHLAAIEDSLGQWGRSNG